MNFVYALKYLNSHLSGRFIKLDIIFCVTKYLFINSFPCTTLSIMTNKDIVFAFGAHQLFTSKYIKTKPIK